ncbi:DUF2515 family protein [Burkholderia ambifaria]|uniref:DUF2515 family protein n=1 Tax=Burkholderia TaxID=32008 RepID=UPI00158A6CC9|nr:hypothetical protein [Burkholderia ambifaria]
MQYRLVMVAGGRWWPPYWLEVQLCGTPDYRFSSHTISETKIEPGDVSFVGKNYGARARRVASSYARMFLEDFHLGETGKVGRFYWTGLGAFAAKQVSANLESWQMDKVPGMGIVHEGLGKESVDLQRPTDLVLRICGGPGCVPGVCQAAR